MSLPVILVVDDDPQVLAAIRRDLRSRYQTEYRVLAAGSGEAALAAIQELKTRGDALALVISDQRMPSMLGVDVLRLGRAFVIRLLALLPRGRPRLIREQAIGRIDDATRPADVLACDTTIEVFTSADRVGERRRPAVDGGPDTLNVWLAI